MSSTDPEEHRAVIIRAVWQVIAENGMGAVSMRHVATAAGISVGKIQYWFATKDELLTASLDAMLSGAAQLHAAAAEGVDDREALWHLIAHPILRAETSGPGMSVFYQYVAGINRPALACMLADAKDGAETEATRLLGRIAPGLGDPRTAARSLIATADGLALRVLIGGLSTTEAEEALRIELNRVAA